MVKIVRFKYPSSLKKSKKWETVRKFNQNKSSTISHARDIERRGYKVRVVSTLQQVHLLKRKRRAVGRKLFYAVQVYRG